MKSVYERLIAPKQPDSPGSTVVRRERILQLLQLAHKVTPMLLRGLWWRVWIKKSGGLLLVGHAVAIRNPQHIILGSHIVFEDFSEVQGLSTENIVFGDHVTVGRFAMIRPSGYYSSDAGIGLKVGNHSNIGPFAFIGCSGRIEIGDHVLMGPRVSIYSENHNFEKNDQTIKAQGVTRGVTIIEDDCWLASNSVIVSDVRIGKGSVVAAGAVVTKDVPPFSIVAGIPAKVIGTRKPTA
jgi:acetyltransferase-like isoleucine patch superfamily enzyme